MGNAAPEYIFDLMAGQKLYNIPGTRQILRPIKDYHAPDKEQFLRTVLDIVCLLKRGHRVMVHCMAGEGRTGVIMAGVQTVLGVRDDRLKDFVNQRYVETEEQNALLDEFTDFLNQIDVDVLVNAWSKNALWQMIRPRSCEYEDVSDSTFEVITVKTLPRSAMRKRPKVRCDVHKFEYDEFLEDGTRNFCGPCKDTASLRRMQKERVPGATASAASAQDRRRLMNHPRKRYTSPTLQRLLREDVSSEVRAVDQGLASMQI